jgi:RimJ/RimL family protein N-acetyltransferase
MSLSIRELELSDFEQVKELTADIWEGNDYIPEIYPHWISDEYSTPIGGFLENQLVALGCLELVKESNIGWVKGIRVNEKYRQKGYGTDIVKQIIELAKTYDVKYLRYATSSRNEESQKLAIKLGFAEKERVGYFRLYPPYPPHPKPSPLWIPIEIDAARLYDVLLKNPSLVESNNLPLVWEFDFKNIEGLQRLGKQTNFRILIDEKGVTQGLFYRCDRERQNIITATYSVFANDRSIFVDMMARIQDELEKSKADRAVFFLGPNATEWSSSLGIVSEEYKNRKFLLYELNPQAF